MSTHQPLAELVPGFTDPTATSVTDTMSVLLALAVSGHPDALGEARSRWEGLYAYLSEGKNPLPAQFSHSVAWQSPAHDPVIEAEVEASREASPEAFGVASAGLAAPEVSPDASGDQLELDFFAEPEPEPEPEKVTAFRVVVPTDAPLPSVSVADTAPLLPAASPDVVVPTTRKAANVYAINTYNAFTPLSEIRAYVDERLYDGGTCPACEGTVKIRPRQIRAELALALIKMWHIGNKAERDWFYLPKVRTWQSRDESFLASFGLIEAQTKVLTKGQRGVWRLTALGDQFVTQQVTVPMYADVYRKQTRRLHGKQVRITDCLKTEWDYSLLMANPNHL